ncbi:MAG: SpoIIE family protein phosphatase [Anaerolineales bacterium]|nr:SpoIIE family protein phosphatase [Anaerolineales bacterium]
MKYKTGQTIFEKGDLSDSMYILMSGRLGVYDGKSFLTAMEEREFVGEMALIDAVPRTATVVAIIDSELLRLGREDFQEIMSNHKVVMQQVIQALAWRLYERYQDLEKIHGQLEKIILPLGIALSTERDTNRLLERILIEAKRLCNADAGTIYLRTNDDHLKFSIMITDSLGIAKGGTTNEEIPFDPLPLYDEVSGEPNDRNVATHVALCGETVSIPDIYHADYFDFSGAKEFDKRTGYRSKSNLTLPLKDHDGKVIGVMQLFNAQDADSGEVITFNEFQRLVAESLTSQAAVALNTQMLLKRQQELLKFEHDLQVGRQIQSDFLPNDIPQPRGWEIAAHFQPAREVAGDFFDVFGVSDGKIAFVIADVCDKGVGAALFMALSRSLIRAFSWLNYTISNPESGPGTAGSPLNSVCLTNRYIVDNHIKMNMFVTMFYGVLDPARNTLTYINAGHNPPALVDRNGVIKARLKPTGPAVGIMGDMNFGEQTVEFEPGDQLLTFTDGVPDARNEDGEFFTENRLMTLLMKQPLSAAGLLGMIRRELQGHVGEASPFDDVTLLALRRKP